MISALPMIVLLAAPSPAEAFAARDARQLRDALDAHPQDAHAALFRDLLALVTCAPLEPLADGDSADRDLRALVRFEASRRTTLTPDVEAQTVWALLKHRETFVRPEPSPATHSPQLAWPAEAETWEDEVTPPAPLKWRCDAAPASSFPAGIDEATVTALRAREAPAARTAAAELEYLLAREPGANTVPTEADVAALPAELRFFGRLQRVLAGAPGQSWAELVADAPAALRTGIEERACAEAVAQRRAEVAAALTGASEFLTVCRSTALLDAGRASDSAAVLSTGVPADAGLRRIWIERSREALAHAALDGTWDRLAEHLPSPTLRGELLLSAARAALDANDGARVERVLARLKDAKDPGQRAQTDALELERAFRSADGAAFEAALARLGDEGAERYPTRAARMARDRELPAVAQRLLSAPTGFEPAQRKLRLSAFFETAELNASREVQRALEPLQAVMGEGIIVAAGAVEIPASRTLPEPAPLHIEWPTPRTLLVVPAPSGELQLWPQPQEVAHAE